MGVMGVMEKRVKAIIEVTTQGFMGVTIAISGISNGYIIGKVHFQWVHYGKHAYGDQQFIGNYNLQATENRFSTQRDSTMQGKSPTRQTTRINTETLENRNTRCEQHTSDEAPLAKYRFACQKNKISIVR